MNADDGTIVEAEEPAAGPGPQFIVIFGSLFVLWATMAVCVAVTFAIVASRDGDEVAAAGATPTSTVIATPTSRPSTSDVPLAAGEIAGHIEVGTAVPPVPADAHIFFGYKCDHGLLTLATTKAFVYAETSCAEITQIDVDPFYAQSVRITVESGRLTIASTTASHSVDVGRVWVLVR